MFISLVTLIFFIYQTNIMRQQTYLSILPYLAISTSNNQADHTFSIAIQNQGVGPAIIESAIIRYQGKKYDLADYDDYLFQLLTRIDSSLLRIGQADQATLNRGLAIPANTQYKLVRVGPSQEEYERFTQKMLELSEAGLDYEIIYRSIQGQRWVLRDDSDGPEPLN